MINRILMNARVLDPARGIDTIATVAIREGVIQAQGAAIDDLPVFDATGCIVMPGLWDVHVHFRDPGNPAAETRQTGARAAAAGGFTHVVTMPNTSPAGDSVAWLREQIDDVSLPVKILPSACVTQARRGEAVADVEALAMAGASSFTDDGAMVAREDVMRLAMQRIAPLKKVVMEHAVVPSLAGAGVIRDCLVARQFGLPIFPSEAEVEAVRRDIALCRETGCAVHIQHISCAETLDLIRAAQKQGLPVTGEATPHHLALAAEDIPGDDGNYRMNPPLGRRVDVMAIRAAIADGTLSLFATDHAPHTPETKNHGFATAAFGIIGLETALGITWRVMVEENGMSPLAWAARWTTGPAGLLGKCAPSLAPGSVADVTVFHSHMPHVVDASRFLSRARNTPFGGWELNACVLLTICEGEKTYEFEGV